MAMWAVMAIVMRVLGVVETVAVFGHLLFPVLLLLVLLLEPFLLVLLWRVENGQTSLAEPLGTIIDHIRVDAPRDAGQLLWVVPRNDLHDMLSKFRMTLDTKHLCAVGEQFDRCTFRRGQDGLSFGHVNDLKLVRLEEGPRSSLWERRTEMTWNANGHLIDSEDNGWSRFNKAAQRVSDNLVPETDADEFFPPFVCSSDQLRKDDHPVGVVHHIVLASRDHERIVLA